jgi:hypothetical protein
MGAMEVQIPGSKRAETIGFDMRYYY